MINFDFLYQLFSDHTIRTVVSGVAMIGIVAGALGTFAVLRQQSLLGDAISHATLPGVGLAFLLTQDKSPITLLIGAALTGWVATLLVMAITQSTRIKKDAALGMVLSVFFGLGVVLLTKIQKLPTATKAGLNKFLFGNASALLTEDVQVIFILGTLTLAILIIFWKEFKVLTFDYAFAKSMGLRGQFLNILLTTLIVLAIVIGLQTVGVVLMSAMLVAPAAAARQWTDRLEVMVILAAILGCLAGVSGAITSAMVSHLPTGPTIVLYISFIVFVSLLFAPNRGLLWDWLRHYKNRRAIRMNTMLENLLLFSEINTDPYHPHDVAALHAIGRGAVAKTMIDLKKQGYVRQHDEKRWALTDAGLKKARALKESTQGGLDVD